MRYFVSVISGAVLGYAVASILFSQKESVVHCKDCTHWAKEFKRPRNPCWTWYVEGDTPFHTAPWDYCSYGEIGE